MSKILFFSGGFFNSFVFNVVMTFLTLGLITFNNKSAMGLAKTELTTAVEAIIAVVETVPIWGKYFSVTEIGE